MNWLHETKPVFNLLPYQQKHEALEQNNRVEMSYIW